MLVGARPPKSLLGPIADNRTEWPGDDDATAFNTNGDWTLRLGKASRFVRLLSLVADKEHRGQSPLPEASIGPVQNSSLIFLLRSPHNFGGQAWLRDSRRNQPIIAV